MLKGNIFKGKTILITGGTGTLGTALVRRLLPLKPKKIIIFSRDEFKQSEMQKQFKSDKLRYILGDVRNKDSITSACKGVDYIIHTSALKQVPALEYNPEQAVYTNIIGAMNVVQSAIANNVKKVVALSTDKAVNPINMYGASKLASDKIFVNGGALSAGKTIFSVVRYGNVANSRGSVIPLFDEMKQRGEIFLPLTDARMTRFYITIDEGVDLIFKAFSEMQGGEIFISKIPSFKISDLVTSMNCDYIEIGIRPGEKLHEIMITSEDSDRTYDCGKYYVILPQFEWIRVIHQTLIQNGFINKESLCIRMI